MSDPYCRFSGRNRLYEYRRAGSTDEFYDIRIIDFPLQIVLIGRQYILPYELWVTARWLSVTLKLKTFVFEAICGAVFAAAFFT